MCNLINSLRVEHRVQAGGRSQMGGLRPMKTPPTWVKTYLRFSNLILNQAQKVLMQDENNVETSPNFWTPSPLRSAFLGQGLVALQGKTMLKNLQVSGLHRLSVLHF